MNADKSIYRWVAIAGLVLVISLLHYNTVGGNVGLHLIRRELYFLPILLASFWDIKPENFFMKEDIAKSRPKA